MEFNVVHDQFELLKSKSKDIEVRLNDPKRQSLTVGSKITFIDLETNNSLSALVKKIEYFDNFFDLFAKYSGLRVGSSTKDSVLTMVKDMYTFYSKSAEKKFGVLAIFVQVI